MPEGRRADRARAAATGRARAAPSRSATASRLAVAVAEQARPPARRAARASLGRQASRGRRYRRRRARIRRTPGWPARWRARDQPATRPGNSRRGGPCRSAVARSPVMAGSLAPLDAALPEAAAAARNADRRNRACNSHVAQRDQRAAPGPRAATAGRSAASAGTTAPSASQASSPRPARGPLAEQREQRRRQITSAPCRATVPASSSGE